MQLIFYIFILYILSLLPQNTCVSTLNNVKHYNRIRIFYIRRKKIGRSIPVRFFNCHVYRRSLGATDKFSPYEGILRIQVISGSLR